MNPDMRTDSPFQAAYRKLEKRMKTLAELDGNVFLPNTEPERPADYVLICMEPSSGGWAHSAHEGKAKVDAGFRNFLSSVEDFVLHFAARHYLCNQAECYHITDMSKGAMPVSQAKRQRVLRYERWYPLLLEELELVASPNAGIVAVGRAIARHLTERGFQRPFTTILHYSPQAARSRNASIIGQERSFSEFTESISIAMIVATAEAVLKASRMPSQFYDRTLTRLTRSQLTTSRKKLLFSYKLAFESMRRNQV